MQHGAVIEVACHTSRINTNNNIVWLPFTADVVAYILAQPLNKNRCWYIIILYYMHNPRHTTIIYIINVHEPVDLQRACENRESRRV